MKRLLLLLLASAATLVPLQPARADVSFSLFYSSLGDYGEWWDHPDYGYCWRPSPSVIGADWRPYSEGYWAYTDHGWTWVSYEDWGWATYHYGRWTNLPGYGWAWVPGYEWAPAWVSWRTNDDYIGWAPLPPRARWNWNIGFSIWVDRDYDIGPGYYNFCRSRDIGAPWIRRHIVPVHQNITIIKNTVNITNITVHNTTNKKIIYNGGPDYAKISTKSDRPVPKLKLARVSDAQTVNERGGKGGRLAQARGDTLEVVAPEIASNGKGDSPKNLRKMTNVQPEDTGWAVVADPAERKKVRDKVAEETRNVDSKQAARPVDAQQVAGFVPDADRGKGAKKTGEPGPATAVLPGTTQEPRTQSAGKGAGNQGSASPLEADRGKAPGKSDREDGGAAIENARRAEADRIRKDAEARKKGQEDAAKASQQQQALQQAQQAELQRKKQQEYDAMRRKQTTLQDQRQNQYRAIQEQQQKQENIRRNQAAQQQQLPQQQYQQQKSPQQKLQQQQQQQQAEARERAKQSTKKVQQQPAEEQYKKQSKSYNTGGAVYKQQPYTSPSPSPYGQEGAGQRSRGGKGRY